MTQQVIPHREYLLFALLAALWGSSYLFIKVAVSEIPPLTLIAARVTLAAAVLCLVLSFSSSTLPRDAITWRRLSLQAFFNSIGAWTLLAWGQQHVDAGLASVLNSTSPLFVFFITLTVTRHESIGLRKWLGVTLGISGVVLLVGVGVIQGIGKHVFGQLACLAGAFLYACAAIYGRRFNTLGPLPTATATLLLATAVLVPVALVFDRPWLLSPSISALLATAILSVFCTALALLIYFRLVRTLGPLGVASQAYLRAGLGVILGVVFLGETLTLSMAIGLGAAIAGVALINWPSQHRT